MKRLAVVSLSLALLTGPALQANAQGRPDQGRPDQGHQDQNRPQQDHRDNRQPEHSDWRRGARMDHNDWDRGARVDYREHRLQQPPRGYEWRQVDGRFVLATIATGIIASIILNGR